MAVSYGMTEMEWDEELDLKNFVVWITDYVHGQPFTPLGLYLWHDTAHSWIQWANEALSVPDSKGWHWRVVDGWARFTLIEPAEEEKPKRAEAFRQRIAPLIENYETLWNEAIADMMERYRPFKEVEIEKVDNGELLRLFEEVIPVNKKMWQYHFYWMFFSYNIYALFEKMCAELLGISRDDDLFRKLLGGFDNMLLQVNRELLRLGDRARELGLAELFLSTEDGEQMLAKLGDSEAGRKWLQEYHEFIGEHGWRCTKMLDCGSPSWISQPSLGIADIRRGMISGSAAALDKQQKRLVSEREEAEKEIMAKVPAEQRDWFGKLMPIAQFAGVYSETHNYYLDLMSMAVLHKVIREIGQRMARVGSIDEPSDVFMLMPDEIRWGIIPEGRINLRRHANRRKEEMHKAQQVQPPPLIGQVERIGEVMPKDPVISVIAPAPNVRPELKADLYGHS